MKGEWLTQPLFDDIEKWRAWSDIGAAMKGDVWGSVDRNGNWKKAKDQTAFIFDAL